MKGLYEYLAPKPVVDGSVPSGFSGTRRSLRQRFWNLGDRVVQYPKPLAPRLVDKYGLVPLSPEDPLVISDAKEAFASDVRSVIIKNGFFDMDVGKGYHLSLNQERKSNWLVELKNNSGKSMAKPQSFSMIGYASDHLWGFLSPPQRAKYFKRILPVF